MFVIFARKLLSLFHSILRKKIRQIELMENSEKSLQFDDFFQALDIWIFVTKLLYHIFGAKIQTMYYLVIFFLLHRYFISLKDLILNCHNFKKVQIKQIQFRLEDKGFSREDNFQYMVSWLPGSRWPHLWFCCPSLEDCQTWFWLF